MIGVFVSLDLFLFYMFWDAMLIPMYFLIGIWGYDRRIYAAVKFILYTMAGSVLMLVAIIWIAYYHQAVDGVPSFDLADLYALNIPGGLQTWLFLAFAVAFAIKVPLFPFHTWLPDAHVEAPTAGSVILAGVLLKMGTYGLLRFAFPLFPQAAQEFAPYIAALAVIGIVYGALVAMVQPDMKKLVAYSSVSHLGFVVLGICALNVNGAQGAVYQMLAHGISTGGLFLIVGMLSDRRHTRLIAEFGGLKARDAEAGGGVPARDARVDRAAGHERLRRRVPDPARRVRRLLRPRAVSTRPIAATGVILSAVYMLWMFQRVNYGVVTNPKNRGLRDLSVREWFVIAPICAMAIFMGVVPGVFLKPMEPAVRRTSSTSARRPRCRSTPSGGCRRRRQRVSPGRPLFRPCPRPHRARLAHRRPRIDRRAGSRPRPARFVTFREPTKLSTVLQLIAPIVPVLVVTLAACMVLIAEAFRPADQPLPAPGFGGFAAIGLIGAIAASVMLWDQHILGFGVIIVDKFTNFFNITICAIGLLMILLSSGSAERDGLPLGEYYGLMLFSIAGMMLMGSTRDLLDRLRRAGDHVARRLRADRPPPRQRRGRRSGVQVLRPGRVLERVLPLRHRHGVCRRGDDQAGRAGRCASPGLRASPSALLIIAMLLLLVGFAFKVSAVPFHMWTPDAYQGAPTLVTGFMSTGVKAAAFAAFVRVFLSALEPLHVHWVPVLSGIAGLTMILGTVVGVAQTSVKRMLAYSSIAHAGYLLVGLVALNSAGKAAILFYLAAYAVTNLGAFGVLAALSTPDRQHDDIRDFAGLWHDRPVLAGLLTVFLLSLGGFPPTVGFVAKWYIFNAALQQNLVALAVLGVLTSVVSVFFYLRIVVLMYMSDDTAPGYRPAVSRLAMAGLFIAVAAVFYLGVLPGGLLSIAADSAASIF